jgi:hypothetical protein
MAVRRRRVHAAGRFTKGSHDMRLRFRWVVIAAIAASGALLAAGPSMSKVEEPAYEVVKKDGPYEIRGYGPMIVAEYTASGSRGSAAGDGFRAIANYIFGGNEARQKIAMTAPVLQEPEGQMGVGAWKVRFIMPRGWSMATLPRPSNGSVALKPVPARRFVVIRFSGFAGDSAIQSQLDLLKRYASGQKLETQGEPVLAFYDPPWTLPFLRRNEIMLELAPQ